MRGLRRPTVNLGGLLRRTFDEVVADDCLGMAAQLAFYFALALFPALIVLVALASYLPWPLIGDLVAMVDRVAPREVVVLVRNQLEQIKLGNPSGLITLGVAGALWTSSSAMVSIVSTLNAAYDVTETRAWWKVRLLSIVLTLGLSLFVLTAVAVIFAGPALARAMGEVVHAPAAFEAIWTVLFLPVVFVAVATAIALVYYFAPDVEQRWSRIVPGAVVATTLWSWCRWDSAGT